MVYSANPVGESRVALITGASRGLGLEIARLFARRHMPLVITARGDAALAEAAAELRASTEVETIPGDVGDPQHAERFVRLGLDRFGRIDVLVNNASALGPMAPLETYPADTLAEVLRTNVLAPLHLTQLVLPPMRAQARSVVINVTSDAAVQAYPTWGGYGTSKAALEHLSRVLAAELEGTGVRVYVVDPGDMNTQMHQEAEPEADLSHLPHPSVIAPAFLRLVEEETAPFGRFEAQRLVLAGVAGGQS